MTPSDTLSALASWMDAQPDSWSLRIDMRNDVENNDKYCDITLCDDRNQRTFIRRPGKTVQEAKQCALEALSSVLRSHQVPEVSKPNNTLPRFLAMAASENRVLLISDNHRMGQDHLELVLSRYILIEKLIWVPRLRVYAAVYHNARDAHSAMKHFSKRLDVRLMPAEEIPYPTPSRAPEARAPEATEGLRRQLDEELEEIARARLRAALRDQQAE